VANGDLESRDLVIDDRFATTVMLVSGGYPGHYEKGYEISGLESTNECIVFHAGTKAAVDKIITSGGRVIAVSALGTTMKEALAGSYRNAGMIGFRDIYFRKDIGFDL
jgi:phosphoribosylamine--glycine ligase